MQNWRSWSAPTCPLDALRTATLNPGRFLNRSSEFGSIHPAKFADLVLLAANPLQDITNTPPADAIISAGRYLSRAALDDLLASVERIANRDVRS
jgi:imidazolonepropionase-like amidohydrolase